MQPSEMDEIIAKVREQKTKNQDRVHEEQVRCEEQEKVIKIFEEIAKRKHQPCKLGYEDGDCPKYKFDRWASIVRRENKLWLKVLYKISYFFPEHKEYKCLPNIWVIF